MMSVLVLLITTLHRIFDAFWELVFGLYYKDKKRLVPAPVKSNNLLLLGATELAELIKTKKVTSTEVVQAYIDRIKEVNPVLNAVVDSRYESALEEARQVDEDIKANRADFAAKPFLGVPFTTKESTQCKGLNITFGLVSRKWIKASEDADVVKNVKAVGGILIAVTNVPQLNLWWETHNTVYGITQNPYDTTRCVGGSSGGESALIAACASPFGVGTDIGGSIRIPSFMCGIFGHKPTAHIASTKGLTFRDGTERETSMVVAGPMSRKACDLLPGLKIILGENGKHLDLDTPVDLKKLRIYFVTDNGDLRCSPMSAENANVVKKAAEYLSQISGNRAEELNLEGFKYSNKLTKYWLSKEGDFAVDVTNRTGPPAVWYKELFKYLIGKSELSLSSVFVLINNQLLPTAKDDWAHHVTGNLIAELTDKLSDDAVLIYPSMPREPHYHHLGYLRLFNYVYFSIFNLTKLPATQVPMGLNGRGLPMGVQVVAGPKMDRLSIAVAQELEKGFGGFVAPFTKN